MEPDALIGILGGETDHVDSARGEKTRTVDNALRAEVPSRARLT